MILPLLLVFAITVVITMFSVPLASLLGQRMGAWDHPDELGVHGVSLPRTGGIAMAAGLFVGVQAVWSQSLGIMGNRLVVAAVLGSAGAFLVGLLDDLHEIKPLTKALGLALAAAMAQLIAPHAALTGFERLDFVIGIMILFFGANALNLLDGMDGLASGIVFISCLGLAALSFMEEHFLLTAQSALVAGAALGFWFFNRPRARIFMGDCGSLMLGFILFGMGLRTSSYGLNQALGAMAILSIPILDTMLAIMRRLLAGADVFSGDRQHIYDLLQARYQSVWAVNIIIYLLAAAFAGIGLWLQFLPWPWATGLLAVSWALLACWMVKLGMFSRRAGH